MYLSKVFIISVSAVLGLFFAGQFAINNYTNEIESRTSLLLDVRSWSPIPTLEPTLEPSPSVNPAVSDVAMENPRLEYVRSELISLGIDSSEIIAVLNDPRFELFEKREIAYKEPNWELIEAKLYRSSYIQKGIDYIDQNATILEKIESQYAVPKESLTGLIAMETDFGNNTGNYSVLNAVYSRMEHEVEDKWKSRSKEVIAFVQYCIDADIDCYSIEGSYAGAFGIVQFLPSSLLAYGVDGNSDGYIDLFDPVDAIPSAANYLVEHGWEDDQSNALARYYGSSVGYPRIILEYASRLSNVN